MDQEVKYIHIKDLTLWTENPRDPIDENASDQDIVNRALDDSRSKWTLAKLAKEMGEYYDFSELPTVVYKEDKPVVYDGNRRMILGKIKLGLVGVPGGKEVDLPVFPPEIPCNVCIEKIALTNVLRKHSDAGSWQPLERDIFLYKFMGESKSIFLLLDENTGIINENPHLNQRFVKEEIFKEDNLKLLGFRFEKGLLYSVHSKTEGYSILSDISSKVKEKLITTRKNRGRVIEVLDPISQEVIDKNIKKEAKKVKIDFGKPTKVKPTQKQTKRTPKKTAEIFGGQLFLIMGDVSNLYRDIVDLFTFYKQNDCATSFL